MGKLVLHKHPGNETLIRERTLRFAALPANEKLNELFALIDLSIKTSGKAAIKNPRGAGLVLRKIK